MPMPALLIPVAFLALIVLVTIAKTLYTVRTYSAGVVERFGKFDRITQPGLHVLLPFAERVFFVDLQVKQAQFSVETKTHDNVFVQIPVSVQYQVLADKVFDAFYKLSAPQKQIESFVFNSILGHVPKLTLDQTFEQQSGISIAVKTELDATMSSFGYNILNALVTDIVPDDKVKAAMNDINAAQRAQVAAQARGEADKILKVKQAEAEAESKALQGNGIARERQAIIDGLSASIEHFQAGVPGSTPDEVMALVLLTQYFDTLRDIGTRGGTNTLFLPNSPGAANDFQTQILAGLRGGTLPSNGQPDGSQSGNVTGRQRSGNQMGAGMFSRSQPNTAGPLGTNLPGQPDQTTPGQDAPRAVEPERPYNPPAPPIGTPGTPNPFGNS